MKKIVKAFFGSTKIEDDLAYETLFAEHIKAEFSAEEIICFYDRFRYGESKFDYLMRKLLSRVLLKRAGKGVKIAPGVVFMHPETIEIGDGVFIGAQTVIQGRKDGLCRIGNKVWIGPNSYFDARDLIIGDNVGWGPGAKVLGSEHTGIPVEIPVINTDLVIEPVRIPRDLQPSTAPIT